MSRGSFRVLLIEDNPADARFLRETFKDATDIQVNVSHEVTLSAGLIRAAAEPFDILFLDLSLPDEEGINTVVRAHTTLPTMPIIVMTGYDNSDLADMAVRQGAQDYLVKGQVSSEVLSRATRYAMERKRAIDELRRSEQYYRSLIENAADIIIVLNPAGDITYSSPSLGRLLGVPHGSLTGHRVQELVHPEDHSLLQEMLRIGWNLPGTTPAFESRWRTVGGAWRVLEGIGQRVLAGTEEGGLVLNSRDVTERKQAEAALLEVNETLRALVETSPLAILSIDLSGCIRTWNAAAEWIFGYTANEAIGRRLDEIAPDCAQYLAENDERRAGPGVAGNEVRFGRRNGSMVDVNVWHTRLWRAGATAGSLLLVADNTDRRRLEEQFRQSQKMEAVGRLAGGVAHDFNNLLTVITGYCELLLDQLAPTDPMLEDLRQVQRAAEKGSALTRQLLAFSRQQITQPRVIELPILFEEMLPILRRITGENIDLRIDVPETTGKIRIDPGQIEQVIVNMVVNARDAMPDGGRVTIDTSNVEVTEEGAALHTGLNAGLYVMIAISDTGIGMSPATVSHLFEPFFTTKERGRGTGLGLSTSYGIVRQNHGSISVYSEVGHGTAFKIYLPRVFEPADAAVRSSREPSLYRGTETVIIVEDEEGVRRVVREMLTQYGYRVIVAPTPEDALRMCGEVQGLDLLITDVIMPNMSGRELADRLAVFRPDLKILFVSGYTDSAIVHHGVLDAGVHFLQKPFTPEQLARKVREVLDRTSA